MVSSRRTVECSPVLGFYRKMWAAATFFEQRFSREYLCTVKGKRLYWDTIDVVILAPTYVYVLFSNITVSTVFKRLQKYPVRTSTKKMLCNSSRRVYPSKHGRMQKALCQGRQALQCWEAGGGDCFHSLTCDVRRPPWGGRGHRHVVGQLE